VVTRIELAPLCKCGQPGPIKITFQDSVSKTWVFRNTCGQHFTDRIWAALMQAGELVVTVKYTEGADLADDRS
jgi:hypothetical protein